MCILCKISVNRENVLAFSLQESQSILVDIPRCEQFPIKEQGVACDSFALERNAHPHGMFLCYRKQKVSNNIKNPPFLCKFTYKRKGDIVCPTHDALRFLRHMIFF